VADAEEVVLVDSMHPDVHGDDPTLPEVPGAHFLRGDVASPEMWQGLFNKFTPTVIFHLAAETGTGISLSHASRHGNVNVIGTTAMLDELFRRSCIPEHIILTSSRAVYGEGKWISDGQSFYPKGRSHDDLLKGQWDPRRVAGRDAVPVASRACITEPRPTNIYAATKLAQEHIIGAWATATGANLSVLRLQNVYGPGQSLINSYTGVLALFARQAVSRQQINLYEDGRALRDFVYIEDVSRALLRSMAAPPHGMRVIDIGSGVATTLNDVAQMMSSYVNAPAPVISGEFRDGDVRAAFCDIGDAKIEIGYEPMCSLETGIAKLLDWVRAEASRSDGESLAH
jgi:dTDP-L-rhamnose 4-epimerase